jgi:hypothetical protein
MRSILFLLALIFFCSCTKVNYTGQQLIFQNNTNQKLLLKYTIDQQDTFGITTPDINSTLNLINGRPKYACLCEKDRMSEEDLEKSITHIFVYRIENNDTSTSFVDISEISKWRYQKLEDDILGDVNITHRFTFLFDQLIAM